MKRRDFLSMTIGSAAFAGARPLFATARQTGPLGANDRIRAAIIGCGNRGNAVARGWQSHADSVFVAACDADQARTTNTSTTLAGRQGGAKVDTVADYRRILDRKDVDALLIATPDHWHSRMCIEAMSAGKDIYCEKPVSNTVERAIQMRDAARQSKSIVQIGTQQRSWTVFQEAAKLFQDGYIGPVSHVIMMPPSGGGGRGGGPVPGTLASEMPAEEIPDGFDWDMFQGPAPRKPFLRLRRSWRSWYDYGGGTVTDWGVHLVDVMAWLMKLDAIVPRSTSASAIYNGTVQDPEHPPNTYTITWQFDTFIATLTNAVLPGAPGGQAEENYGDWFYGQRAVMALNRFGYDVRPYGVAGGRGGFGGGAGRGGAGGRAGAPGAAGTNAPAPAPAAPPAPAAGGQGPVEAKRVWDSNGRSEAAGTEFDKATINHVRNFLDSVKSRKPTVCPMEAGVAASMPALLGLVAIREGRTVKFDGTKVS